MQWSFSLSARSPGRYSKILRYEFSFIMPSTVVAVAKGVSRDLIPHTSFVLKSRVVLFLNCSLQVLRPNTFDFLRPV
uniref:Uncharacterized protein n=1 Tax=Utricularia reniformis TaxID=192314 RepID=A0A1Y0AYM8_9LAMI|nr:hypothetical protein AEK19_MT0201 [Utricularia reniformis]ART30263.1 hypothetical protein AEK19_MT0201 [Utricularia reniformis]